MAPTSRKQKLQSNAKGKVGTRIERFIQVGLKIFTMQNKCGKNLELMKKHQPELVNTLKNHLTETNEHVSRLEKIFEVTGIKPAEKMRCYGRILKESDELISKTDVGVVRDASIIASEKSKTE
jgi:ferritin-like metal-binding protein YciE